MNINNNIMIETILYGCKVNEPKHMEEITFEPIYCNYCKSTEVTYNQLIMDSYCSECGEWQDGEY
jgi:hypothetical protein